MLNKTGIYKIVNKLDGKVYYGSAATAFSKRWRAHRNNLNKNTHSNLHIQRAWNKDGGKNFEFSIVLLCDKEHCLYYEQLFLDKYWDNCINCYNICKMAGSTTGRKLSEKQKQYLIKLNTGHKYNFGRKHSQETRKEMSRTRIGNTIKSRYITFDGRTLRAAEWGQTKSA